MRITLTRDFYTPKNYIETRHDDVAAVVYVSPTDPIYAMGFSGKRAKPDWHHRFRDRERLDAHVAGWLTRLRQAHEHRTAARKARAEYRHTLAIGEILVASWGYEQTNIDFYEVTGLIGLHTVIIREIGQTREDTHHMQGNTVPRPGHYTGEPMAKRVQQGNRVAINSYTHASHYEMHDVGNGIRVGRPMRWSSYA